MRQPARPNPHTYTTFFEPVDVAPGEPPYVLEEAPAVDQLHVLVVPRYGDTMCKSFDKHTAGVRWMQSWVAKDRSGEFECEVYAFVGQRVQVREPESVFRFVVGAEDYEVRDGLLRPRKKTGG